MERGLHACSVQNSKGEIRGRIRRAFEIVMSSKDNVDANSDIVQISKDVHFSPLWRKLRPRS